MSLKRLRARLLACAGLLAPVSPALAADGAAPTAPSVPVVVAPAFAPVVSGCPDGCGPALGGWTGLGASGTGIGLFAPNRRNWRRIDGQHQPACANNNYPLSDWAYLRRFCGPTLIPGSCYGHFQTKWRKWEDHCPQPGGCATAPLFLATPPSQPQPQPVTNPPQPMPVPKMDEPMKPRTDLSNRLPESLPPIPDAGLPAPPAVRTGR